MFGFRARQLTTAALVGLAVRPPKNYWLGVPAMLGGGPVSELAPHVLGLTLADSVRELTRKRPDRVGLALAAASTVGAAALVAGSLRHGDVVETALRKGLGARYRDGLEPPLTPADTQLTWKDLAFPFPVRDRSLSVERNVSYGSHKQQRLDVYRRLDGSSQRSPMLVHLHGGMWMSGDKRSEGVALMQFMAARGWTCINANYRLSPGTAFPAQVVDVKRVLSWVRDNAESYGGDPSFIAVTGGSAGGHLAALAALTPGDPAFQPGFEDADTSVQAAVPHYGIFDFAAESGTERAVRRRDRFLARFLVKKDPVAGRGDFDEVSPLHHANDQAPPFFVVHGTHDTGVEVEESRYFVERLRSVSRAPVAYAEIPGAQHAFDRISSLRSARVLRGVHRFLTWAHSRHPAAGGATT